MIVAAALSALACLQLASCSAMCCYNTTYVPAQVGCYNDSSPFDGMPLPQCNDDIHVNMTLYTRNSNPGATVTKTTIPSVFNRTVRTHFLVHGWMDSGTNKWMHDMKNEILKRGDYNVITVSWPDGAKLQFNYPQAASNTRVVGTEVALVAKNLVSKGASWAKMYCTGHSLGSHVCGHAGQRAEQPFGRITGLDPAGPLFDTSNDPNIGLDATDALLVDVMHTSGQPHPLIGEVVTLGTMKRLGHMDFYPNGGGSQPGCIVNPLDALVGLILQNNPNATAIGCSHFRAFDLYTASVNRCKFRTYMSCLDQFNLPGSCFPAFSAVGAMGFDTDAYTARGIFYLTTGASPFC